MHVHAKPPNRTQDAPHTRSACVERPSRPDSNIQTTYYDTDGRCTNYLGFGGWAQYTDATGNAYGLGRALRQTDIASIVSSMLAINALPTDPLGIYLVITAVDVYTDGLCNWCGWHT